MEKISHDLGPAYPTIRLETNPIQNHDLFGLYPGRLYAETGETGFPLNRAELKKLRDAAQDLLDRSAGL